MRLGDRLDGHIVSGHVDGVGEVEVMEQKAESLAFGCQMPNEARKIPGMPQRINHHQRRLFDN